MKKYRTINGQRHAIEELSTEIVELLDYWQSRCVKDTIPSRADFDPADLPHLLPRLILVDVLREPEDFRFRLIGSFFYEHSRKPLTGMKFSDLYSLPERSTLWKDYRMVVQTGRPYYGEVPYVGPSTRTSHVMHLLLPLARNGKEVDMVLGIADFHPR